MSTPEYIRIYTYIYIVAQVCTSSPSFCNEVLYDRWGVIVQLSTYLEAQVKCATSILSNLHGVTCHRQW
jgi:hypothetical protein